jgi:hypothetical protein
MIRERVQRSNVSTRKVWIQSIAGVVVAGASVAANASLILDTGVTSTFNGGVTSTGTGGNDLPGRPSTVYFGQLQATANGYADFFYVGNEAAYTNTLFVGGSLAKSTTGLPDNFNASYPLVGSVGVTAGQFVDFGLCTTGGASLSTYGRCVDNDNAASVTAQFNYGGNRGYRSIAFRPLSSFDAGSSARTYATLGGISDLWMIFWDDSGASNDDDHDDLIAVARFQPVPVQVPEPSTMLLFGAGLAGLAFTRRRRAAANA